jgi:Uma2 family endonuclease
MSAAASLRLHDDTPREDHMVHLRGVSWEDYERLLEVRGDHSAPRFTYLLLEAWCIDRNIELMPYGSWTLKNRTEERGAEPDECYVFGTEPAERPQLAIEVEWTSGGLDKLEVYKKLGVGEIWYWRKGGIHVFVREADAYQEVARSRLVPDLDLELLASFLDRRSLTRAVHDFRAALAKG